MNFCTRVRDNFTARIHLYVCVCVVSFKRRFSTRTFCVEITHLLFIQFYFIYFCFSFFFFFFYISNANSQRFTTDSWCASYSIQCRVWVLSQQVSKLICFVMCMRMCVVCTCTCVYLNKVICGTFRRCHTHTSTSTSTSISTYYTIIFIWNAHKKSPHNANASFECRWCRAIEQWVLWTEK